MDEQNTSNEEGEGGTKLELAKEWDGSNGGLYTSRGDEQEKSMPPSPTSSWG